MKLETASLKIHSLSVCHNSTLLCGKGSLENQKIDPSLFLGLVVGRCLTYSWPVFPFFTTWKHGETKGFLLFRGIKYEQWAEMGYINIAGLTLKTVQLFWYSGNEKEFKKVLQCYLGWIEKAIFNLSRPGPNEERKLT